MQKYWRKSVSGRFYCWLFKQFFRDWPLVFATVFLHRFYNSRDLCCYKVWRSRIPFLYQDIFRNKNLTKLWSLDPSRYIILNALNHGQWESIENKCYLKHQTVKPNVLLIIFQFDQFLVLFGSVKSWSVKYT